MAAPPRRAFTLIELTDGASNTLMIGEDLPAKSAWSCWNICNQGIITAIPPNARDPSGADYPRTAWWHCWGAKGNHPGGVQFVCGDGHVGFIKDSVSMTTYRALGTMDGGEVVGEP